MATARLHRLTSERTARGAPNPRGKRSRRTAVCDVLRTENPSIEIPLQAAFDLNS